MKSKNLITPILLLCLAVACSGCSNTAKGINADIAANTKAIKKEVNEH